MKPYYEEDGIAIYHGDCREVLPKLQLPPADAVVTDPPYGDTSLDWDAEIPPTEWLDLAYAHQVWCFGSFRYWMKVAHEFSNHLRYGQEIIWEKHNGSGFHADRFKRVHELAVHWYRGAWGDLYLDPPTTNDARKRTVRRKRRPTHTGHIENSAYASEDGGPRLMRSVLQVRSEHGRALHPTQKPLGVLSPLISYSAPPRRLDSGPLHG